MSYSPGEEKYRIMLPGSESFCMPGSDVKLVLWHKMICERNPVTFLFVMFINVVHFFKVLCQWTLLS